LAELAYKVNSILKNNHITQTGQLLPDLSGRGKSELHRTRCRVIPGYPVKQGN
jgi:hypothetical protein